MSDEINIIIDAAVKRMMEAYIVNTILENEELIINSDKDYYL